MRDCEDESTYGVEVFNSVLFCSVFTIPTRQQSSLITLWRYFIPATVAFLSTSVELAKLAVVFCGQVKSSGVHNSFSCWLLFHFGLILRFRFCVIMVT